MKSGAVLVLVLGIVAIMGVHRVMSVEGELPLEDGVVSATKLPLDVETAEVAYQTATFGMG